MKKDKEWLKEQIKYEEVDLKYAFDNYVPYEKVLIADDVNELLNQLDEPELPVIPQFVADWIEYQKTNRNPLLWAVSEGSKREAIADWLFPDNYREKVNREDLLLRVWLSDYTIEKEKMYHVLDQNRKVMIRKYRGVVGRVNATMSPSDYPHWQKEKLELTEKEIKDYDERYWAFAEGVPNE